MLNSHLIQCTLEYQIGPKANGFTIKLLVMLVDGNIFNHFVCVSHTVKNTYLRKDPNVLRLNFVKIFQKT